MGGTCFGVFKNRNTVSDQQFVAAIAGFWGVKNKKDK